MTATWPAAVIEALPCGLVLFDAEARTLLANRGAENLTSAAFRGGENFFEVLTTVDGAADAKTRFLSGADTVVFPDVLLVPPEHEERVPFFVRVRSFEHDGERFGVAIIEPSTVVFGVRDAKHDLNNALMGVLGYTELLKGQSDLTERAREKVESISKEVDKMQERVTALGKLARKIAESD